MLSVLNALRLATVEMHALGTPAHAAVNGAVAALRAQRRTAHAAGLANAVLRKVAEDEAAWRALPPPELPGWLRGRLLSAYGAHVVAEIEAAHLAGAPLDLSPKDGDAAALAARLGGTVLPSGSVRLGRREQVRTLAGFADGQWWVQDAAAALPARILAPRPGERIVDLCAAPGGKTMQLAAAGAAVTAVDASPDRTARLAENLARTGLAAHLVVADALDWWPDAAPDAVLLDAPCTATGTIRRHPELPFIRSSADVRPLAALQARLLDHALALLAPGGRLVYCTCSLLPEEGEHQVASVLDRNQHVQVDPGALLVPGVAAEWRTAEGGLRLRPDFWAESGGMDGFYVAVLRKTGC